jgi:hypothetical protein
METVTTLPRGRPLTQADVETCPMTDTATSWSTGRSS